MPGPPKENENAKDVKKVNVQAGGGPAAKRASIVFLGETGVGKTTLLCSLRDYIENMSLDRVQATPRVFGQKAGQSQTQEPYDTVVKNNEYCLTIIDTPGIGDTAGLDKDKQHIDNICSFLGRDIEFNAIAIVLQSGTARAGAKIKYVINEIKTNLPKSAQGNFIVLLTRGTGVAPGKDTTAVIKELGLPLKNVTMIDNQAYEELLFDESLSEQDKDDLRSQAKEEQQLSYEKTHKKWGKLLDKICDETQYPLYQGQEISDLREKRRQLQEKIVQCREKIQSGQKNAANIDDIVGKIERASMDIEKYKDWKVVVPIEKLTYYTDPAKGHRTVCIICGSDKSCHNPCGLVFGSDIRQCWAMVGEKCRTCHHSYQNHCHSLHWPKKEIVNEEQTIEEMKQNHGSAKSRKEELEQEKEKLSKRKEEIEKERDELENTIFDAFKQISEIAILGYNDDYGVYVDTCIEATKDDPYLTKAQKDLHLENLQKHKSIWETGYMAAQKVAAKAQNIVNKVLPK